MGKYLSRILDKILEQELQAFGAVLISGPKWCGKTTTAKQQANSVLYMQSPDERESYMELATIKPSLLLNGDNPRLIDEWQMAPQLWDAIRHDIDLRNERGLYILTGSTSVDEKLIMHSGAGRISRLKMYTMSLFESEDSNGKIRLSDLFDHPTNISEICELSIEDYAKLIVRGGWPGTIGQNESVARRQIAGYCDTIVKSDISTVDGVTRDELRTNNILRSYARHVGAPAAATTILEDIIGDSPNMHINTLNDYLNTLRKLFVIEDLPAWSPRLRSKTTIRTSSIRHFIDPALAAYFLDANSKDLIFDLNTYGFLFESLVIRDLKIYAQALDGKVSYYRDRNNLEVDAIVHLDDGRWAAIEVKLGSKQIDQAANNLLKLKSKVDTDKMQDPSFLMVITATKYAYRREDGVYVVPIGLLGP